MNASQRHLVDIPENIAYLNCACLGPLSHAVVAGGETVVLLTELFASNVYAWRALIGSEDFTGLVNYQATYLPGARRFDVGECANFHTMPALNHLAPLQRRLGRGPTDGCPEMHHGVKISSSEN